MDFFVEKRNKALFAGMLVCAGLLECIFAAYATEGLFSFLYPVMIDLIIAAGVTVLATFTDLGRKMNALFVGIGCFVFALFSTAARVWFIVGREKGFLGLADPLFLKVALRYLLICMGVSYSSGLLRKKKEEYGLKYMPLANGLFFFLCSICFGESFIYSLFISLCAVMAGYISKSVEGGAFACGILNGFLLMAGFICACVLFFVYDGGMLLTVEAACAVDILIILVGMISAMCRKNFGAYLYTFVSLHLALAYTGTFIKGDCGKEMLFGVVPCLVMTATGALTLYLNKRSSENNTNK